MFCASRLVQTKLGQAVGGTSFHVHKFMPIFNYAITAYSTFFGNWDPPFIEPVESVDAETAFVVAALFKSPCTVRMAICMVHLAACEGQDGCLRELHKLASITAKNDYLPRKNSRVRNIDPNNLTDL